MEEVLDVSSVFGPTYKEIRWLTVAMISSDWLILTFSHFRQSIDLDTSVDKIDSLSSGQETIQDPVARSQLMSELLPFLWVLDLLPQIRREIRSVLRKTREVFEVWRGWLKGWLVWVRFEFSQEKSQNSDCRQRVPN